MIAVQITYWQYLIGIPILIVFMYYFIQVLPLLIMAKMLPEIVRSVNVALEE